MAKFTPTEEQKLAFINEVAPLAQKAYLALGKVLPSVCIGMACIESGYGYGTDGTRLMYKHNACWGQKVGSGKTATKYWSGKFFTAKTSEEYTVGVHTIINDAFRSYDTLEQGCFNYYELLNTSLYKKVTSGVDYVVQMQQIKDAKYMTSSTEVNSVIKVINKYNLVMFDQVTHESASIPAPIVQKAYQWEIGKTYSTHQDLYIREAPNGEKKNFEDITEDAQKHGMCDDFGKAILNNGTRVTVKDIKETKSAIWLEIPSGWICGKNSKLTYVY